MNGFLAKGINIEQTPVEDLEVEADAKFRL